MAINLADKFSPKVDERFTLGSITAGAINNDYDWQGVDTIKVYSIPTVALGDYTRTGSNRYGTPTELQDTVQTMKLTQDKAFTFTVDKGNELEQMGAKNAGVALRREIDEVVIPSIDQYRLTTIATAAGTSNTLAITNTNAYQAFLTANNTLTDNKVPTVGRMAYVTGAFLIKIKTDANFIKASDIAQNMLLTGQVGMIDGVPLIYAPTGYLPATANFLITHRVATVAPQKLTEYKLHVDPPGLSGNLVEGRLIFDTFVLENKKMAIYYSKSA